MHEIDVWTLRKSILFENINKLIEFYATTNAKNPNLDIKTFVWDAVFD